MMPETRRFCTCGHSYWSHRVGRFDVVGRRDEVHGKIRHVCERMGCHCVSYTPTTDREDGSRCGQPHPHYSALSCGRQSGHDGGHSYGIPASTDREVGGPDA